MFVVEILLSCTRREQVVICWEFLLRWHKCPIWIKDADSHSVLLCRFSAWHKLTAFQLRHHALLPPFLRQYCWLEGPAAALCVATRRVGSSFLQCREGSAWWRFAMWGPPGVLHSPSQFCCLYTVVVYYCFVQWYSFCQETFLSVVYRGASGVQGVFTVTAFSSVTVIYVPCPASAFLRFYCRRTAKGEVIKMCWILKYSNKKYS
jgi:hypothetical protein